jgi:hypothetical protein
MNLKFKSLGQLVLLIALAVPHACSQMCTLPPAGMISWWTGDGTALDYFGRNDGLTTFPVAYAAGEVADAFNFSGSQVVQVLRTPSLEPAQVTVDAWVNASASPGVDRYIVSKGGLGDLESSYALYTGAAQGLQFYVFDGTVVTYSPDAGTGVWDGNWHHAAGTYDGTAVRLFVDGTEVGTGTPATTPIAYGLTGTIVTNDLFVGDYNPFCTSCQPHAFVGAIDEVEIFERALPQTDIARIFAAGKAGKCLPVQIEIEPSIHEIGAGDFERSVRVVILGSPAFNAADIVQSTLRLFPASDLRDQAPARRCHLEDVNGDGIPDLVCHFHIDGDDDGATVIVAGQVSVPGGQRTFFGAGSIKLE